MTIVITNTGRVGKGDQMNKRIHTRRKADRSHDTKFVLFLLFSLICTSVLFYSFGYERGAAEARDRVLQELKR